jgi:hypothetical protein
MFNKNDMKFISLSEANKILQIGKEELKQYKSKKERQINLNDSILILLSSIEHKKKVISRTLMQREVFLFYEEILKPMDLSKGAVDAGFFPYKYGPYSIDVNLSLSILVFSGKINVSNYFDEVKAKGGKGKFLTVFETSVNFDKVASRYEDMIGNKGYTIIKFHELVEGRKWAWDQSTAKGITSLLLSKGFRGWYEKKSLEEVYPSINFGKITEEYRPRVKF